MSIDFENFQRRAFLLYKQRCYFSNKKKYFQKCSDFYLIIICLFQLKYSCCKIKNLVLNK